MFGRSSAAPSRSPMAPARPAQPPPMAQRPTQGGGMMSGLAGTMMTGMAFGAGSEVAHQAVRGIMGSGGSHGGGEVQQQAQPAGGMPVQYAQDQQQMQMQQNPCTSFNQSFLTCLKSNSNDIGMCQNSMNMLMQCEQDNARFYGPPV